MTAKKALKYSLTYFIFGLILTMLSIFLSSRPSVYSREIPLIPIVNILPVVIATLLIYFILSHNEHKLTLSNQNLQDCYDDLYSIYEELLTTQEELRHRFEEVSLHHEELSNRNVILATLQDTTLGLINQLDRDTVLHRIILRAAELAGTSHGFICLFDGEKKFMDVKVGLGLFENHIGVTKIDIGESLINQIIQTGAPGIIENCGIWPDTVVHTMFLLKQIKK